MHFNFPIHYGEKVLERQTVITM